jgi:putative FmdB family regulatory protein
MPIYEYKCDNCGEVFEVRQKFADEPVSLHVKCGGPVHRLLSTPALQFKGSGFYVNDYGRGSNGGSKKSDKESKEGKSSSDTKSSETKSETKSSETKSTESKPAASKSSGGEKPKSE